MPTDAAFESFEIELNRLVESFGQRLTELKQSGYAEAQLRDDFLNPFFRALGWDMENRAGLIQKEREVEIESLTHIGGGRKRADYLFRADKRDRFVCEAKKPVEELHARYAFQAKRYAWNKTVPLAVLTDFEELKIYIVGGKPHLDEPHVGEWKSWHFRQYPVVAREIWDLLARDPVAGGSIDQAIDALPKRPAGKGNENANGVSSSSPGLPAPSGLPWVTRLFFPQPQRGCVPPHTPIRHNRVAVENNFDSLPQGSRSAPTLGWRPLPRWGKPADKARHDKLLGLMPKLRAATSEAEKATLQNAVTATETLRSATIDQLVYELYGLTVDEIKLVKGEQ